MTTTSVVYLVMGIFLVRIGVAIKSHGRRKVADDGWSHPIGTGLILLGLGTIAASFCNAPY